jgi:hypothetical protein
MQTSISAVVARIKVELNKTLALFASCSACTDLGAGRGCNHQDHGGFHHKESADDLPRSHLFTIAA